MPDYAVRNTANGDVRIVSAQRPETALRHVTTGMFSVSLATAQDGIDAGRQGRRIEIAGEEPVEQKADGIEATATWIDELKELEPQSVEQRVDGDGPAQFVPDGS